MIYLNINYLVTNLKTESRTPNIYHNIIDLGEALEVI